MYTEEHYLKKIERNTNVLDKAPEHLKKQCRDNIIWARELSSRLEQLDYEQKQQAIANIHQILDSDYQMMGFELPQSKEKETSTRGL